MFVPPPTVGWRASVEPCVLRALGGRGAEGDRRCGARRVGDEAKRSSIGELGDQLAHRGLARAAMGAPAWSPNGRARRRGRSAPRAPPPSARSHLAPEHELHLHEPVAPTQHRAAVELPLKCTGACPPGSSPSGRGRGRWARRGLAAPRRPAAVRDEGRPAPPTRSVEQQARDEDFGDALSRRRGLLESSSPGGNSRELGTWCRSPCPSFHLSGSAARGFARPMSRLGDVRQGSGRYTVKGAVKSRGRGFTFALRKCRRRSQ